MNPMRLSEAAALLGGEMIGTDVTFTGVSTDSRQLRTGQLFVALSGEHFDGHDFVEQARGLGAAAALVSRRLDADLPLLQVDDTRRALGQLAAHWRNRCSVTVIAVTGSNGKTTTKDMIAAILRRRGAVLSTRGNLNNDIGVPLTLLQLTADHRYAVIEMGANHAGEIGYLAALARPQVALITNAGPAHLEGFGSIEGVARAKGEIYSALPSDGVAIVNADDPMGHIWRAAAAGRSIITFGLSEGADVSAAWKADAAGSELWLRTGDGTVQLKLPLPGRHNVMNALAAAAASAAAGASPEQIRSGLESLQPVAGRLQIRFGPTGMRVLDDTYNANPASLQAAVEVLVAGEGHKWLVLGDMAELGTGAARLHEQAGLLARGAGVERFYALGELSRHAVAAFGEGARHFDDAEALAAALWQDWQGPGTVLVKGSRSMHMERIVAALLQHNQAPARAGNGDG